MKKLNNSVIKNFYIEEKLCNEDFFNYIESRTTILPHDISLEFVGCFPILKDNILTDIRLSVPEIKTKNNILVNIHEYYHAIELYNELGNIYIENKEVREINAINMEKQYIKKKSI